MYKETGHAIQQLNFGHILAIAAPYSVQGNRSHHAYSSSPSFGHMLAIAVPYSVQGNSSPSFGHILAIAVPYSVQGNSSHHTAAHLPLAIYWPLLYHTVYSETAHTIQQLTFLWPHIGHYCTIQCTGKQLTPYSSSPSFGHILAIAVPYSVQGNSSHHTAHLPLAIYWPLLYHTVYRETAHTIQQLTFLWPYIGHCCTIQCTGKQLTPYSSSPSFGHILTIAVPYSVQGNSLHHTAASSPSFGHILAIAVPECVQGNSLHHTAAHLPLAIYCSLLYHASLNKTCVYM